MSKDELGGTAHSTASLNARETPGYSVGCELASDAARLRS
jgi:hypothetical protein